MEKQMRIRDIKIIPIGNSKGVRIPKTLLQKYGLTDSILLEETNAGLLLRTKERGKLSWANTYKAMAAEKENWNDFDTVIFDGLEEEDCEY